MPRRRRDFVPLTFAEAAEFVRQHHRHLQPPQGHKFSIGLNRDDAIVGVVVVGRPVARMLDDTWTAEVTRCCVLEGYPGACSQLYGAAWRAAREMGYRKLITYTLADTEPGTSLKAAGWQIVAATQDGQSWGRRNRPRVDLHPLQRKLRWEVGDAQATA